ncbi:hypothetical protein KM043_011566 [Ampulex compressa]|nr:hypothetical protein KM043_011566 [Ampulex compressa]
MASDHYCIWGSCNLQQYCCGDNVCCDSNESEFNTLFIVVITLGTLILAAICCIYVYYNRKWFHSLLLWKWLRSYVMLSKTTEMDIGATETSETLKIQQKSNNYIIQINEGKTYS